MWKYSLLVVTYLCGLSMSGNAAEVPEGKKLDWIAVSEQGVRAVLKDGASATFRNEYFVSFRNTPLVCGEVNSKNGFGGYTGYQHFIAGGDTNFIEEDFKPGEFAGFWNQICVAKRKSPVGKKP